MNELKGYKTLQFHYGGLFDFQATERDIHLVRLTNAGTPGPTLCGRERFDEDGPGWSVGGGVTGDYGPCRLCVAASDPTLPVSGMFRELFADPAVERFDAS